MGVEPTRAEHNGLAVHRLNHSATSSHRGCAIEPDANTATHPERERHGHVRCERVSQKGKVMDTGDVVPKMASYARLRKTTQAFEGPSRRGWDSNPRVQSTMDEQSIALTTRPPRHIEEPDGNTATHPEREGMEGKELDTGDVVPKMASYARLRKTTQALEGPSRRGWDSNIRVQSTMD